MTTTRKPNALRPVLALGLVLFLSLTAWSTTSGQAQAPTIGTPQDPFDWRWAITQGGLTVATLVLGWTYRRDVARWADDRVALEKARAEEKSAFEQARTDEAIRYNRMLEAMMVRSNAVMAANSEALAAHSTALSRNTDSTHRLANAVEKVDVRLERVEHQE